MKNKKFFDIEHANLYLSGSIIRVDGVPVRVEEVIYKSYINRRVLYYHRVGKKEKVKNISIRSPRVDMNPIPLGFVNFSEFGLIKKAIRTYRVPARQWRIGLTAENLKIVPSMFDNFTMKRKIMESIHFKNSVCGNFPNIEEIIEMIKNKKATSQAFSRDFAIEKNNLKFIQLKDPVGKIFKGEAMLFDDYLYLSQLLEKAI